MSSTAAVLAVAAVVCLLSGRGGNGLRGKRRVAGRQEGRRCKGSKGRAAQEEKVRTRRTAIRISQRGQVWMGKMRLSLISGLAHNRCLLRV
jgi:hypothetical protein